MRPSKQPLSATRRLLLGAALVAALAAAFAPKQESATTVSAFVERATDSVRKESRSKPSRDLPEIAVVRSTQLDPEGDPFKIISWKPEPPPQKPEPPPPPVAPPLPYSYLGQIDEGGKPILFLGSQENTFAVRVGDTLEGSWRLDAFTNQRAEFTYLPLKLGQTMDIGGTR